MKRTLSALLAVCILAGCLFCCAASSAEEKAAGTLYDMGLFRGTGADSSEAPVFELGRQMTRCEAVTMLVRLLGGEDRALEEEYAAPFTDVQDWAKPYVGYAYSRGLTRGVSAKTFGSSQYVTAAQYLTFILRALGYDSGADFSWDSAWELTDRLGITHGEYGAGGAFTRGGAAVVSLAALGAALKGSRQTLREKLESSASADSGLEIHFIDVGEADAALLICGGEAMMIDGGNAADSDLIYAYLKKNGVEHLKYIICTHLHEDHVGGLSAALNCATVGTVYCSTDTWEGKPFNNFLRYVEKRGASVTVPSAGDTFSLGGAFGTFIGPVGPGETENDCSLVVRIVYGDTSFLFAADAETGEETDILGSGCALGSTVLKVGHHGSDSSSSAGFLRAVSPAYAVISVGADNVYSHPSRAVLDRLSSLGTTVFRTDLNGDVICRSDSKTVSFSVSRQTGPSVSEPADSPGPGSGDAAAADADYVFNIGSGVFHRPGCSAVSKMSANNRLYFKGSREEALGLGYRPCGFCRP